MAETRPTRAELKQQTRERIAAVAMNLFATHGYPAVSVATVARAVGVTEKTVFNHFSSKPELVYSNDQPFEDALLAVVAGRAVGVSAVDAAATFLLDRYARMLTDSRSRGRQQVIARLVASSPDLREHEASVFDRYAGSLARLLADEQGAGATDLRPHVLARSVLAVHRTVVDAFRERDDDAAIVGAARQAFDLLAAGSGIYAPRPAGHVVSTGGSESRKVTR